MNRRGFIALMISLAVGLAAVLARFFHVGESEAAARVDLDQQLSAALRKLYPGFASLPFANQVDPAGAATSLLAGLSNSRVEALLASPPLLRAHIEER
jgi:hypothetical protein